MFGSISNVASCRSGLILSFVSCALSISRPGCDMVRYGIHSTACSTTLEMATELLGGSANRVGRDGMFVNSFPLVATDNAFIVGNTRHIVISRLMEDPNICCGVSRSGANGRLCSAAIVPGHNT